MRLRQLSLITLFLVGLSHVAFSQQRTIRGVVTGPDAEPVAGATVQIRNTSIGTQTDVDGAFTLPLAPASGILVVSYTGMTTRETPLTGANQYEVVLERDGQELGEVVVTALGMTKEKKALGYSVQELKGEELNKTRDANIVNALSGKVAGVQVTSSNGAVGASSRIVIRGNSTFKNNQPLFVVDGVPILNDASTVNAGSGVDYGNGASDIDPNNIASMSVLKGANAAALYGSRAANGVILITTKKGSSSRKLGVDVSSSVTFDNAYVIPRLQNSYGQGSDGEEYVWKQNQPGMSYQDYAKQYSYNYVNGRGAGVNDMRDESWGPRMDAGLKLDQFFGDNQDWVSHPGNTKEFYETGITTDNNVSITAGGEKATARLSLSNLDMTGSIPNTDLKQKMINLTSTFMPTSRLQVQVNMNYINRRSDNLVRAQYSSNNPVMSVTGWFGRQIDMKLLRDNWKNNDENGNPYNWQQGVDNPYLALYANTNGMQRNRVFGNVNASYELTDWLLLKGVIGTDYYSEFRKNIVSSRSHNSTSGGKFDQTQIISSENNADLMLIADKKINSAFHIDGMVGTNIRNNKYRSMWLSASQLTVPDLYTIANVRGSVSASTYESEKETQSVYGAVNLAYNNYLFLGLTGRNDWSSTLPANNRSYFYPSASLGFVFSEALGLQSGRFNYGKLRLGWAQVGNDTDPYATNATYSPSSAAWNGVALYNYTRTLPPLNLKPEITNSFEVGAELRFLQNRLSLDATYYSTSTRNQIMSVNISKPSGFGSMLINAGRIDNKGVELQLAGRILDNPNGLNWEMIINWARNRNKVVELYPGIENYVIATNNVTVQAVPGEAYGLITGGAYLRNDQGRIVVNATGIPIVAGNEMLGNITPDWTGGVNNIFSYKRFMLSALIDMRMGGDIFSYTQWHNQANGTQASTVENGIRENGIIINGVYEDGHENTSRISAQEYFAGGYVWSLHENAIIDGSYVKFRELSIGYSFPVQNIKFLQSARLSVVGRNLALLYTHKSNLTHIDPETGLGVSNSGLGIEMYQIPPTRSVGLKLQFGL